MTPHTPARPDPSPPLGSLAHFALAIFFLALALYGSLVPFHFRPVPWDQALVRWRNIPWLSIDVEGRSDFVANILLFIPLGYLFLAALSVDRHPAFMLPAALLVLPALCGLAVAIEFTQIWFEPRTVSLNDIAAESMGAAIGAAIWMILGQRITARAREAWSTLGRRELATRLLPAYLAFLVLIHVMPLDLTISPVELWHKYKQGRIVLVPFATPVSGGAELASKLLWNTAYFLPVGLLLASMRVRRPLTPGRVLGIGVLVTGICEFLQLFVWTRYADVTDILTGTAAILAGWSVARAWKTRASTGPNAATRAALIAAWAGVLMIVNWYPFDFLSDLSLWNEQLQKVSPVPFADLYTGSEYHAFDQILHKTLLFLPVGVLLARRGRSTVPAILAGLALSVTFEVGQLGLPTRYASVTDVLVETSAAWLGCFLTRRVLYLINAPRAQVEVAPGYGAAPALVQRP